MLGVLVNTVAVLVGGLVGLLFKKGIPERVTGAVMQALGLCVTYVGISGMLEGENTLVLILSMVFGTATGTLLNIDGAITRMANSVEKKFQKKNDQISLAEGFVTASLLFCIGAMAIVGSLNAGLRKDYEMLFTKSLIDMISACMLSVSLGFGVLLSAVSVLLYQGLIVLLSQLLAPILNASCIAEITCAGSLMIVAIGLNMIGPSKVGLSKIKVANFLPTLVFVPLFCWLMGFLPL